MEFGDLAGQAIGVPILIYPPETCN